MEEKKDLYLDCDGVLKDTITTIRTELTKIGYDYDQVKRDEPFMLEYLNNQFSFRKHFLTIPIIDDNINKTKIIINSGIYRQIAILTHYVTEEERDVKYDYFSQTLPGTKVICVPKQTPKSDVVKAKDTILVDDYLENTIIWEQQGGIGIKYGYTSKPYNGIIITDLLELLNIPKKTKTRIRQ